MENTCTLVGNCTRDPELRFMANGKGVASFGLAVNRRYQVNGEWREEVSFFDVTAFGDIADNAAASVSKGDRLVVTGRLTQRTWDDKETGKKRSAVEITADEIATSLRFATVKITKVVREAREAVPA